MELAAPSTGGDIWTIPTTISGLGFLGCAFDGYGTTKASGAIIATASNQLTIVGCRFKGDFSDAVIEIGAGASNDLWIVGNTIQGANVGVEIDIAATFANLGAWIKYNDISVTTLCIDDNSSKVNIVGNNCVSLHACTDAACSGAMDANVALSVNNYVTTSDSSAPWPVAVAAS